MGIFGKKLPAPHVSAPTVGGPYILNILSAAGFPASEHNLHAVTERVSTMFLTKAHQFMTSQNAAEADAFVSRMRNFQGDMAVLPQQILDGLVAWNTEVAPHIQDLPDRVRRILLESRDTPGGFFNGRVSEPLPLMSAYNK